VPGFTLRACRIELQGKHSLRWLAICCRSLPAGTIRQAPGLYELFDRWTNFGAIVPRKIAKHKCPHCGASYEMGVRRETHRAYHTAVCSYCGDVMAEWHGYARRYRRLSRPRSPATFANAIVVPWSDCRPRKTSRTSFVDRDIQQGLRDRSVGNARIAPRLHHLALAASVRIPSSLRKSAGYWTISVCSRCVSTSRMQFRLGSSARWYGAPPAPRSKHRDSTAGWLRSRGFRCSLGAWFGLCAWTFPGYAGKLERARSLPPRAGRLISVPPGRSSRVC